MLEGLLATIGFMTSAAPVTSNVHATLVAEHATARPGKPLWVGVRLGMATGWHTYWSNPGDSGLPTKVEWTLPAGWSVGPLQWPLPSLLGEGPVKSYGYSDEVLLATALQVPLGAASGQAEIAARVSWLECKEICKPGKATLKLGIAVDPGPATPSKDVGLFASTRKLWPVDAPVASATFEATPESIVVSWPAAWAAERALFFPEVPGIVEPAADQPLSRAAGRARLTIPRPAGAGAVAPVARGVLVVESRGSKKAYRLSLKSPTPKPKRF